MHDLLLVVTRSADELDALFFGCGLQRARLFGPAIFEASKLKVLFVGVDEEKHPGKLPRTYTLTHSDVTARLTLAVSHTIHAAQLQGWYNRLQRDEVVAEWKKVQGAMSLHVHCHISGGHFLLDLIAPLRYYIFRKELPVVRPIAPPSIDPSSSHNLGLAWMSRLAPRWRLSIGVSEV